MPQKTDITDLILKLRQDKRNLQDNFGYYDNSDVTKKLIGSERRQIERLIDVLEVLRDEIKKS